MAKQLGYTASRFQTVAAQSCSFVDMLRRLDQRPGSGPLSYLRKRVNHYGIDTSHFRDEQLPKHPRQRYTKEILEDAAAHSYSIEEIIEYLNIPPYNSAHSHIGRSLDRFGIDTTHFTKGHRFNSRTISEDELRTGVEHASSLASLMRFLHLPDSTTTRRNIKRFIARYEISTDHFTGQRHNLGRRPPNRKTADEILQRLGTGSSRTGRKLLHRVLQEKGVAYICAKCGTGDRWQGQRLVLEIDHINGDRLDNRIQNLRYLCPSCHSQTRTHSRRRVEPATLHVTRQHPVK